MKWNSLLICILSIQLHAKVVETEQKLVSKVVLENQEGYFALEDGSFWKVFPCVPRWRSLSEWWNGVDLIAENFKQSPREWISGSSIEILSKTPEYEQIILDASNKKKLDQSTHLLHLPAHNLYLFAVQLSPLLCFEDLFNEAYEEGYAAGKDYGYNKGYYIGHSVGYLEGLNTANRK